MCPNINLNIGATAGWLGEELPSFENTWGSGPRSDVSLHHLYPGVGDFQMKKAVQDSHWTGQFIGA